MLKRGFICKGFAVTARGNTCPDGALVASSLGLISGEAMQGEKRSFKEKAVDICRNALTQSVEAIRAAMFATLSVVARHLPRSWALGLANFFQSILAISPIGGRARRVMAATFPSECNIKKLTADWLGRPFRDHVMAVRIASAHEPLEGWTIETRNAPWILKDAEASFIIASGHFSREAMTALYLPWVVNRRLATVVAPMTQSKDPRGLRVRLQMREMRAGIKLVRNGDVDIAEVAGKSFLVRLLHHLRDPGGAVIIATDASWGANHTGGYTRPFAGYAEQSFALGTARLARLSQRPIVTCVPFLDGDRRIVVDWSPVIPAPERDDADADIRVTNEILDWIERRIGERPDQYVLSFGRDRRWSSTAKCWIDGEAAEPTQRSAAVRAERYAN